MLSILLNDKFASDSRILRRFNSTKIPFVSGLEIKGQSIYNICPGTVVSVGRSPDNTFSVSLLVNSQQMIRYTNLSSVSVFEGCYVRLSEQIGQANSFVRVEYCTPDKKDSRWVVRIHELEMYKHNPEGLLTGQIILVPESPYLYPDSDVEEPKLTQYQNEELSNNRGDGDE